jgi:putative acetyltransferase
MSEVRLVTVLRSADSAIISIAKSILQSAEIPFATKGEGLQDLFAWGRVHGGTNIFVGPVEIQVDENDTIEAADLLKDVTASKTGELEIAEPDTAGIVIETRDEELHDYEAIRGVHEQAFHRDLEAILVDRLRKHDRLVVSLVAVAGEEIVGHVAFSPITVGNPFTGFRGLGLGPVAVLPDYQNNGIGSKLIENGLDKCRTAGYDAVTVLGDPAFYSRFGFVQAGKHHLGNEYGADDSFMILELKPHVLERLSGLVKYADDFGDVGL